MWHTTKHVWRTPRQWWDRRLKSGARPQHVSLTDSALVRGGCAQITENNDRFQQRKLTTMFAAAPKRIHALNERAAEDLAADMEVTQGPTLCHGSPLPRPSVVGHALGLRRQETSAPLLPFRSCGRSKASKGAKRRPSKAIMQNSLDSQTGTAFASSGIEHAASS